MANNYFSFKQFTIHQQHCAMKVTTDACLFGAITAREFEHAYNLRAFDVGTGTGLLSLMLAQKNTTAHIDAVEIDADTAAQAKTNIAESKFSKQVAVFEADIKTFATSKPYKLVICNPPFYEQDLKSPDEKRNKALHDATLTLEALLVNIERLISAEGRIAILLPWHRSNYFLILAKEHGWFCYKNISLHQTENHQAFRSVLLLSKASATTTVENITIKINNEYSAEFVDLLKDYYLYL